MAYVHQATVRLTRVGTSRPENIEFSISKWRKGYGAQPEGYAARVTALGGRAQLAFHIAPSLAQAKECCEAFAEAFQDAVQAFSSTQR